MNHNLLLSYNNILTFFNVDKYAIVFCLLMEHNVTDAYSTISPMGLYC